MRYLIVSDIHANLEALEACLNHAEGNYSQIICLGDLVGYGPDPNRVVERTRELALVIVRGNHDRACAGLLDPAEFNIVARWATEWTRRELTRANFEFLRSLPKGPISLEGFQAVHGSPLDEDEYILEPAQAMASFRVMSAPLVFFGHTHRQGGFVLSASAGFESIQCSDVLEGKPKTLKLSDDQAYLINPGSVGQPRDADWHAAYAILDTAQQEVSYFRVSYDLAQTQAKMRAAGLPEILVHRLAIGR